MLLQSVRSEMAIRQQRNDNPSAMFWQSVRSRRGPIYRARIYENTHEMEEENVRALK